MRITTARRLAQIFFFALFVWLAFVATVGSSWSQWRGWPVTWFLQLDPLVAVGTVLTTHSFHPLLAWSVVTLVVTILLGRVFCGFVCPFGAIHQFVGWLGRLGRRPKDKMALNAYRPAQRIKYYLLLGFLAAASGNLLLSLVRATRDSAWAAPGVAAVVALTLFGLTVRHVIAPGPESRGPAGPDGASGEDPPPLKGTTRLLSARSRREIRRSLVVGVAILAGWLGAAALLSPEHLTRATLQIGWLDPIPLVTRSFNLVVLPAADLGMQRWFPSGRFFAGAGLIGGLFLLLVLANLVVPRFFCRFLCPTGALLGVVGRGTLWSIGKTGARCTECSLCDVDCEGACNPTGPIRISECLMCMNCLDNCPTAQPITYGPRPSPGGEIASFGMSRRGFVASVAAGLVAVPLTQLEGSSKSNWSPGLVRPPGSVAEEEFLARCLKCSECMRVCPTNTLQPAGFEHGWQSVWTPVLNNRIGTSGCQLNCIACGHACPTGAIRPLSLDEKHGTGAYAEQGPVRIGLAYVDRGRCLPWAMERPCIVCEENCPVTPKAITVSAVESTVRDGELSLAAIEGATLRLKGAPLTAGRFASGDYSCRLAGETRSHRVVANTSDTITLEDAPASAGDGPLPPGAVAELMVRLQRPVIDPARCIGCGVCEHECPLSGLRAIRVTADNETRGGTHGVLLRGAR